MELEVYVIHCRRLRERRVAMARALAAVGRSAVWVEQHDPPLDRSVLDRVREPRLTPAEVSLYAKHLAALRQAHDRGARWALVLEDDALLTPEAERQLQRALRGIPEDAQLVCIGASARGEVADGRTAVRIERANRMRTNVAYLVSAGGCQTLLGALEHAPIALPIDHAMDRLIEAGTLRAYWSRPALMAHGTVEGTYAHSLGVGWRERSLRRRLAAKAAQLLRRGRHALARR
ncbi:MAG: hypothetical protein OXT09_29865 [Myxococcales bacterium]|nr:hypothetical protein [Myxococcales bacterium]